MAKPFDIKTATVRAEDGDPESQLILGDYYSQHPDEAKRDYGAATSWYERSFKSGRALAAHRIGELHEKGTGRAKSSKLALEWYKRGSEAGCVACSAKLMFVYANGRLGVKPDPSRSEHYQSKMEAQIE